MAQVQVYNQEGRKTSKLELADSVFGIEPNKNAMHLAVVSYLAAQRQAQQYMADLMKNAKIAEAAPAKKKSSK